MILDRYLTREIAKPLIAVSSALAIMFASFMTARYLTQVAEVYPDLVTHSPGGEVEAIQYRKVNAMLLNEVQKLHRKNLMQAKQIDDLGARLTVVQTQYQALRHLSARLARLEALQAKPQLVTTQAP